MKKRFFMFSVLFAAATSLFAANELSVSAVTIPQGATVPITIDLTNERAYTGFTFNLNLPTGVTCVSITPSDRYSDHTFVLPEGEELAQSTLGFGCVSLNNKAIKGNSGALFTVNLTVANTVAAGTELTATLDEAKFIYEDGEESKKDNLSDVSFKITVAEPLPYDVLLDETSTTAPEAAEGVTVMVKRSFIAGVNTICLPFAMAEAQLKAAFGDDVKLYDFTGYTYDEDADNLKVNFEATTALVANRPYVIKLSSALAEFMVENVDIAPSDELTNKIKRTSKMTGNYIANTAVDEDCLFLYEGKFYYSNGSTKMKAFRAFFDFGDVLNDKSVAASRSRIAFDFTDDPTAIQGIARLGVNDGRIYSLRGQNMGEKMDKLPKGVYIVNGKKVVKK